MDRVTGSYSVEGDVAMLHEARHGLTEGLEKDAIQGRYWSIWDVEDTC